MIHTSYFTGETVRKIKQCLKWLIWVGGKPYPVSLAGDRLTFYSWGADLKTPYGILVHNMIRNNLYLSPDGTPAKATKWFFGEPRKR